MVIIDCCVVVGGNELPGVTAVALGGDEGVVVVEVVVDVTVVVAGAVVGVGAAVVEVVSF